jgi:hypothetical protein
VSWCDLASLAQSSCGGHAEKAGELGLKIQRTVDRAASHVSDFVEQRASITGKCGELVTTRSEIV